MLDDPIGAIVTLGAGKLASGAAKVLAGRVRALVKALRGAKSVQEAAAIRRQIIAMIRDTLGRTRQVDPTAGRRAQAARRAARPARSRKRRRRLADDPREISDTGASRPGRRPPRGRRPRCRARSDAPTPDNAVENGADFVDADGRPVGPQARGLEPGRFDRGRFVAKIDDRRHPSAASRSCSTTKPERRRPRGAAEGDRRTRAAGPVPVPPAAMTADELERRSSGTHAGSTVDADGTALAHRRAARRGSISAGAARRSRAFGRRPRGAKLADAIFDSRGPDGTDPDGADLSGADLLKAELDRGSHCDQRCCATSTPSGRASTAPTSAART